jgi:hypothetical protein
VWLLKIPILLLLFLGTFQTMVILQKPGEMGISTDHPDATTYSLIILALTRRFMATGGAINLYYERS